MSDLERERDFYRQQCNELGARLLRLQEEQTQARREARRNRTTARLIREVYRLAASEAPLDEISLSFLQIVLDTMSVDRAMLLEYVPEQKHFVIQNALGLSHLQQSYFLPPDLPEAYCFVNSRSSPSPVLDWLRHVAGGPYLLWAFNPGAKLALLVSNDLEDQHFHRSFEAGDREIVEGVLSVFIDIIERIRAKEALQQSEEKYRLLAENVMDVIWTADLNLRFTYVSPSVFAMRGYTPEEAIRQSIAEVLPPHSVRIATQALTEELERERSYDSIEQTKSRTLELENLCKDGSTVPVEVKVTFLRDADGQPSGLLGVTRDISERKKAEELIKTSLREKEVLLKEIHHRVKNNLQIISSLLSLQAGYIEDQQALKIFRESEERVRSMALIHEKLYQSDNLAQIDFAEYIRELAGHLFRSYNAAARGIQLDIQSDDIWLNINTAVPCGLILNELIANSLKHAFPKDRRGEIHIRLCTDHDDQLTLRVGDEGIGFPEELDFRHTTSLGLQLVNMLVNQLDGSIELHRSQGTTFELTFAAK
jgi:PAS domain S-box-containing protein